MATEHSMYFDWAPRFERAFRKLPREIKLLFDDKIVQFEDNWHHPSLRVKRLEGTNDIWEASVNMSIRFTFKWLKDEEGNDLCQLRNIGDHDHCLRPPY
ncbi:MAG: type II toxin-antitoxin system RelE family toxin [Desulfitobacteriaceae bacterium]